MVLKLVSIKEVIMKKCTIAIAVVAALLSITAVQASEFSGAYISGKIGYNTSSPATNHTMDQLYPGLEAGYGWDIGSVLSVSYTHLRAHETGRNLVCRLLLEKKKT